MIEVRIDGLLVDNSNKSPVVLLRETEGDRILPIYIGPFEASAIAYALEGTTLPRPMTLDLMLRMVEGLDGEVQRIIVTRIEDDTYFAEVVIRTPTRVVAIDARPSDSVGLALRAGAPIFVAEEVMGRAGQVLSGADEGKVNQLRSKLREIEPEDFGNFRM